MMPRRLLMLVILGCTFIAAPPRTAASAPETSPAPAAVPASTAPAAPGDVAALIRELSDESYPVRVAATRRLCAAGPAARPLLEKAAAGEDSEAAIRARRVLAALNQLLFAGVDVQLAFTATSTTWDRPVDLQVTFVNRSEFPARLPFPPPEEQPANLTSDAQQAADMLDLADWLTVTDPEDRQIALRVDDINIDPEVAAVVDDRIKNPPTSMLAAGASRLLTLRAFNRGWARYPLLERGTHRVAFEYAPEWDDAQLNAQQVGRIAAEPAVVEITEAAPPSVSRSGVEVAFNLNQEGTELIARVTNRSDRAQFVNQNYGGATPMAQGKWLYTLEDVVHEVPLPATATTLAGFAPDKLIEVGPGDSMEVARIATADLREALQRAGADLGGAEWSIRFSYANACDRRWQARERAGASADASAMPPWMQQPLPARMLISRHLSNPLKAPQ